METRRRGRKCWEEVPHPYPFNAATTIRYQLPQADDIQLSIYNILGQRITPLVDDAQPAGCYAATWNGKDQPGVDMASGIYRYRLTGGNRSPTKKMLILR